MERIRAGLLWLPILHSEESVLWKGVRILMDSGWWWNLAIFVFYWTQAFLLLRLLLGVCGAGTFCGPAPGGGTVVLLSRAIAFVTCTGFLSYVPQVLRLQRNVECGHVSCLRPGFDWQP
eukprot:Hpha_TRINITY_DN161_c0_g1::TRINITY_DN161_c0_g1_i2::g.82285::m.82285